jgi:beta-glucosidase
MEKWGFRGFVVSDWRATMRCEGPETCLNAGLSLEMPRTIQYKRRYLRKAFKQGKFTEETLDNNIKRLLRVMFLVGIFDDKNTLPKGSRNTKEHQLVAKKIAEEGIVLLKNQDGILPLKTKDINTLAVLGPNADRKMAEAGGSSQVKPPYEITPLNGIKQKIGNNINLTNDVSEADAVILVLGLNHEPHMDAENWDKKTLKLPDEQIELINSVAKLNENIIVVLINGSPITMDPWIEKIPAIIEAWYPGMEGGSVIADILFGDLNPSGKLPLTFPKNLSDSPAHQSERRYSDNEQIYYDEDIFVGYRFFDKENIEPLFPFGFGLSYTTFSIDNLRVNKKEFSLDDTLEVKVDVKNTGSLDGSEVIQLYIKDVESTIERPPKELKGFEKVNLKSGETKTVTFTLKQDAFSFFNEDKKNWEIEQGEFELLIGTSSRDIYLKSKIEYTG